MPRVLELSDALEDVTPSNHVDPTAHGPLWPAIAIFVVAFIVARCFERVECAVDAVFISAMRDQAEYGAVFMSDELRDALDLAPPGAARPRARAEKRTSGRHHHQSGRRRGEDLV